MSVPGIGYWVAKAAHMHPERTARVTPEGRTSTAAALFLEQARELDRRTALHLLASGGAPANEKVSWAGWAERSRAFAAALVADGQAPGSTVAIFAGSDLLWPLSDLGALLAGCVSVGLYPTSAPPQVRHILHDARASVLVVDTAERLAIAEAALEDGTGERPAARRPTIIAPDPLATGRRDVIAWSDWIGRGRVALDRGAAAELDRRMAAAAPDDIALLIYTSGSTGEPKGARIPHRYLLASAESVRDTLGLTADDTALSFLPFCHAAERVFGLYTRILCGMECGLVPDHTRLDAAAVDYGPSLFGGLPRFYEKVYEALEAERAAASGEARERWDRALALGRRRSRHRRRPRVTERPSGTPGEGGGGDGWSDALEREWSAAVAPVAERLRKHFGGRLRLATSGGAALPLEVAETLDALGVTVLGAYGLTEHLCAVFNRPDRYSFDTAGPPMPGTTLRLGDDGEILLRRSDLTFAGYQGRPEESRAAFTEGGEWLRTGDLGELDERGFLRITGRKKELIALSTGKKVAPVPVEAWLVDDPWIGQAVLYGEGRKFVSALLTLRRPVVEAWARERGLDQRYEALVERPEVRARVQEGVDRVNARLSRTEQVRRFIVLDRELSLEEDELTPTLKVRRRVVTGRYRHRLDALYA